MVIFVHNLRFYSTFAVTIFTSLVLYHIVHKEELESRNKHTYLAQRQP